jgi:Flp pilus assembly protein TadB
MTLTWLLLAVGFELAGGAPPPSSSRSPRRPLSLRALQRIIGAAVALACIAAFGVGRGLLAALVIVPLAVVVTARLHERPQRARANPALALTLDLVAVALRAGQPPSEALILAAPAADGDCGERLARVGGLLRLGADPAEAWRAAGDVGVLEPVAVAAIRSASSGVRLAAEFEQLAREVRAQLRSVAQARAARSGVLVAAPLGLCFLPSFVCLGIVPTVVGIAGAVLSGAG